MLFHSGHWRALSVMLCAVAMLVALPHALPLAGQSDVWPTDRWPTATPESQGLDSGVLADMIDSVRDRKLPVHSILILRHGRAVLDATFYPYEPGRVHDIASATKSVTSVLIGIAIDKGLIKSVNEPVASLLSLPTPRDPDPRKARMTVEHLLTMTSGLDCDTEGGEKALAAMRLSDDWAAFAFALPMRTEPDTRYAYCSCNNHLLSSIISARTGDSALAFARTHLFAPLGITDAQWPADPRGRTHGWGDLHLHPRDLAKIAYLYQHGGRWNGKQIVSEAWVKASTRSHVTVRDGVGYGYSWWINTARQPNIFEAVGRGGQRAAVLPDKDIVIVFTGGGANTDEIAPFLFRAIKADAPLPESASGIARLKSRLDAARQPSPSASQATPSQAAPLPGLARVVSGRRYAIDTNPLKLTHLSFTFSGPTEASATLRIDGREFTVPIGLDARARFSSSGPFDLPMATRGEWTSPRDFLLDLDTVANINHFLIRMTFNDDATDVRLRIDEKTGELKDLPVAGRAERVAP
jgi:CubicO group peptidase (beta-lactamase class C family)